MSKPKALNVGNWLTLVSHNRTTTPDGGEPTTVPVLNALIGKRRQIMAARSKFVEIGESRSRLDFPKAGEFFLEDDRLVLKPVFVDTVNRQTIINQLVYLVEIATVCASAPLTEEAPTKYAYVRGSVMDGVVSRLSSFVGVGCDAEILANAEEGYRLVSVPPFGQAVLFPHDSGRAAELSVELTEAIRQAMHRSGM